MIFTIDDLRDGTIIIYGYDENRNRIKEDIQKREGNIRLEYFGPPEIIFTRALYTIEITDELIIQGREKYKDIPPISIN